MKLRDSDRLTIKLVRSIEYVKFLSAVSYVSKLRFQKRAIYVICKFMYRPKSMWLRVKSSLCQLSYYRSLRCCARSTSVGFTIRIDLIKITTCEEYTKCYGSWNTCKINNDHRINFWTRFNYWLWYCLMWS